MVLLRGLPHDAAVRMSLMVSLEDAERDRIKTRKSHYAQKRARQEVASG